MALVKNIETPHGLSLNSYVRVTSVGGGKERAIIEVKYFISQQASREGKEPLLIENYDFVPDCTDAGYNFIKQAYLYLKTLPEFADAIDA